MSKTSDLAAMVEQLTREVQRLRVRQDDLESAAERSCEFYESCNKPEPKPEPTYGPITIADLVDFLSAATANKDNLCAHDYYASEAWAVMDLLGLIDGIARDDLIHAEVHHKLIEVAERTARAYAKSLGEE